MSPTGRRPNLERRRERQDAFLAAFDRTGIASTAGKLAGIPSQQHYGWLKNDPDYAARFSEAQGRTRELAERNARPRGPAPGFRHGGRRGEDRARRQEAFLEAIGRGLPIMAAAREIGMGAPTGHYQWMNIDPEYAARFRELYDGTAEQRSAYVSVALTKAAELRWEKPENHESLSRGQSARRRAESGVVAGQSELQGPFLAAIAEGLTLQAAVRDAGITKTIHRQWLDIDPEYAQAFTQIYGSSADARTENIRALRVRANEVRWSDPSAREDYRTWSRDHWTPERREEFAEYMRERYKDPERRERLLAAARSRWDRPNSREANSERMRRLWADPDYRDRYQAAIDNPERKAKLSAAAKAQWAALPPEERTAKLQHMRRAFKGGHKLTAIEAAVMQALNDREILHLVHKQVGRYVADILVPALHLVIECDGAWFHDRRKDSDEERDAELQALGFATLRLSEAEIKARAWTRLDQELARLSK